MSKGIDGTEPVKPTFNKSANPPPKPPVPDQKGNTGHDRPPPILKRGGSMLPRGEDKTPGKRPALKVSAKQENPESGSLSQRFNKNARKPPNLKKRVQEKEPAKRVMGEKKNLRTKPGPAAPPKNPPKPKQDKGLTPTFNRAAKGMDI